MEEKSGHCQMYYNKTMKMGETVNPLPPDVQKVTPEVMQQAVVNRMHDADGRLTGTKKG